MLFNTENIVFYSLIIITNIDTYLETLVTISIL